MAKFFIRFLFLLCAALFVAEFIFARHTLIAPERLPLFFIGFGFVAFLIVVGGGVLLARLVRRPADYYETRDDE